MVTREGDCTLMHCTLGGPAERTYDLDRDTRCCASEAIQVMISTNECTRAAADNVDCDNIVLQVMGSAWLVVRFCVLTDTYGPGCSFLGETHSYVESCLFQVMSLIQKDALKDSHVKSCLFQDDISANKIKSSLHTDGAFRAFSRGQLLARPLTTRPRSRSR
jgi:hypothetical protein